GLDATLGKTSRSLKGNPEHLRTVQSIALVKRLMARMEVSTSDESADLDAEQFKDLWIFLGLVLENTICPEKENFSRYPSLIPIALARWLMKQMEEAEDKGIFVDFDEDVTESFSNKG
ncbi:MAG: hypothetical protein NTV04_21910, partial [Deltaproteobacteria bacterium]|nr:hypothetical protein [Deltaproteobacteria bacterium]